MSNEYDGGNNHQNVIYTVVPMSNEVFDEIEATVVQRLRKNYPAYDYYAERIDQIFAGNPKLVGVLERGNIVALSEEDVEDLVSIISLHMDYDILMRKAIYHEGVLNGMRMDKDSQ